MAKEKRYVDILELSMIPGIAAIIRSKSCNIFSFRVGILLCAVTGFVWQTKVLVEEYLKYPTVLHIEEHHVRVMRLPAVTFCYANGLHGVEYCPEIGCKRLTVKEFKALYPGEKVPTLNEDFYLPVNLSEIYMLPPNKLLKLANEKYGPMIRPYFNYLTTIRSAIMKTAPFVRSHSNVPPKCYYFNVIEINETLSKNIRKEDFSTGIELHLRNILLPDSGSRLDVELGTGQISVHSRNNFNNPFLTGMSVQRGKNVILRVKQVLKKSLPYPYETDCHDYVSEIEERSSPGPTNQMECIEQCKLNLSLLNHDCVLESIWYPHNFQRCRPVNQLQLLGEYHEKCAPQCHEACSEMTYEVQKDEEYIPVTFELKIDFDSPFITEVVLKRNRRVDISIVFDRAKYHIHEKQPKYNIVEVMSNIGGFLGMWMGVSLIAILNLFEIVLTIFFFCIKKRKSKKISKFIYIA